VSDTDIARFRRGLDECLGHADQSATREIEALWLSLAENYRFLLTREQRQVDGLAAIGQRSEVANG